MPRPPRKPKPRHARISPAHPETGERVLFLFEGEGEAVTCTGYHLREFATPLGRAFRLEKFEASGGEVYEVLLAADGDNVCCCKGHLRWGHRTVCKHLASLQQLTARGKL